MAMAKMTKRILFGSILIALIVGVFWLESYCERTYDANHPFRCGLTKGLPLAVLFLPILIVAFLEYGRFVRSSGSRVLLPAGLLCMLVLAILPVLCNVAAKSACCTSVKNDALIQKLAAVTIFLWRGWPILFSLILAIVFANQMISGRLEDALRRIASTLLGILYIGVGAATILLLRIEWGLGVLILFLAAVKFTDIGAYFTGSFLGKHKMILWLSPGKTWEGLAGGIVFAGLVGVVAYFLREWNSSLQMSGLNLWKLIVFCIISGLAGQFGDLCESLLKRSAGVKDSGALVPEFGGVLDIIDSPLLAAPVACLLLAILA